MITPQEYAQQEADRIKAKHETAFERGVAFLEGCVRGPGEYKLITHFQGEVRPIAAAQDKETLDLVVQEFRERLRKAGWSLYVSSWGVKTWWRHGYVEVKVDEGF
jgi:hypothetical protein